MIQNVLSKQSRIKLHQFLGTCTVIPLHSCLEFQELLVLSILQAGWGSFSSKWQRHSRTVFYLGTAALIFILRSPIKKLQAIPCRLSGEKKAQGLCQGTMSCCPIQLKQFTILVLYISYLNLNSKR